MKIYVSDKEKDYYITYGKGYEALELNKREPINIISLEQREEEIRKQERQKVIAEIEEWIKENHKYYICRTHINHLQGKSFSPHMAGASISVYLDTFESDIKQKLNEMKGER